MEPILSAQRVIRSKTLLHVDYGFGEAIGKLFGGIIQLNDEIMWRAGKWVGFYQEESSNQREL
jgi:hypothetical protein